MRDFTRLVGALLTEIVATVHAIVAGDVRLRDGLRPLLAAVVAVAVAVLVLRVLAWVSGDVLLRVVERLLGAA